MASNFFAIYLVITFALCQAENLRPVIGIISQSDGTRNYIAASYVKYLESAGARVVPILSTSSTEEIQYLFSVLNGVLFPGGGASLVDSGYFKVSKQIYDLAMTANDKGDYFPLWGTCLGFELLMVLTSGTAKSLSRVDAENISLPLNFTSGYKDSRIFAAYSEEELSWLQNEPITMNNHHEAILTETFKNTPKLNSFFKMLSTNKDRNGLEFVSTVEAIKYPFYAVQWHPEKNTFEWNLNEVIHHSFHAVRIAQTVANFFVNEARNSSHSFASLKEAQKWLIYNYNATYSGKTGSNFEQVYIFD